MLGKKTVADVIFVELSLSSITLDKYCAEYFLGFAEFFELDSGSDEYTESRTRIIVYVFMNYGSC